MPGLNGMPEQIAGEQYFVPAQNIDLTAHKIRLIENIIMGLFGTVAGFLFPHNEITLTEQAAALAKVEDGGVFLNLSVSGGGGGYTANYQLFPDVDAINDAVYFGAVAPFGALYMDMTATVQTYAADAITWEYYNGLGWKTLTIIYDHTDSDDQDGDRPFQEDGYIIFSAPTDWVKTTVDSQSAYWIRARVSAAQITIIGLTDSLEHKLPSAPAATEVPSDGKIGRARITFGTKSTGTADTTAILMNLTSGAASAIKTLTKAKQEVEVADFALIVSKDDGIVLFYISVDGGGTEYANGIAELRLVRS